jgi:hypothetical protein
MTQVQVFVGHDCNNTCIFFIVELKINAYNDYEILSVTNKAYLRYQEKTINIQFNSIFYLALNYI